MTQCTHCVWVSRGYKGTNGCIHSQWRANANMPAHQFCSGDCFNTGMVCTFYCTSMSHDASSLCRGFEIFQGASMQRYCVQDSESISGSFCHCFRWYRCTGSVIWTAGVQRCVNMGAPGSGYWSWTYWQYFLQIGTNCWEIDRSGNHWLRSDVVHLAGDNVGLPTCCELAPVSNAPTAPTTGTTRGVMWVEGEDLHFRPEQQSEAWEHAMQGTGTSASVTPGAIWIDNSHYLNWANSAGTAWYRACWRQCQFASVFGNSAGANPSPGASYAGSIWVDGEFGYSHLAYIGCDGNKYLTGAGNCPYVAP